MRRVSSNSSASPRRRSVFSLALRSSSAAPASSSARPRPRAPRGQPGGGVVQHPPLIPPPGARLFALAPAARPGREPALGLAQHQLVAVERGFERVQLARGALARAGLPLPLIGRLA